MLISIIIPAYNEASIITQTLERIFVYCDNSGFEFEIIVVTDGCSDNTAALVRGFSKYHAMQVIERHVNKGKGYSIREGMLAAKGDIMLFADADNATDISHFSTLLPFFEKGADVVICSRSTRDHGAAKILNPQPLYRHVAGMTGNLFIQSVVLFGIWDTQCGFKAFRAIAAKKIFETSKIDGWAIDIECLALARLFGYKIAIAPAFWRNGAKSSVNVGSFFEVFRDCLKIRRNMRKLKHNLYFHL